MQRDYIYYTTKCWCCSRLKLFAVLTILTTLEHGLSSSQKYDRTLVVTQTLIAQRACKEPADIDLRLHITSSEFKFYSCSLLSCTKQFYSVRAVYIYFTFIRCTVTAINYSISHSLFGLSCFNFSISRLINFFLFLSLFLVSVERTQRK